MLTTGLPWALSLEGGVHFEYLTSGGSYPRASSTTELGAIQQGTLTDGITVLRVSDDVARIVAHVGDSDVEARVADGLAVYWTPEVTAPALFSTTITAYAADGSELETGPLDE